MDASKKNPIEQRIEYLASLWNEFAKDPEPRLLRWLGNEDASRMVDLLIEIQSRGAGDIPDLFLRFSEPFEHAGSYAASLLEALKYQYQESRQELADGELPCDWQCPQSTSKESALDAFVAACISFKEFYRGKMLVLALALTPTKILGESEWQSFIHNLLRCDLPQTIRVSVFDSVDRPMLAKLCEEEPELTRTVTPELDMPSALEEIAASAQGVGPGNEFRLLFVKLSNAMSRHDENAARKIADQALGIAKRQKWYDLQVVVQMMLGGMFLAKKALADALAAYGEAGKYAREAEKSEHPAGKKLCVQVQFAQAGALVSGERHNEAAAIYEATAPLASAQNDTFLELEAWRMASYCYEMAGRFENALRCGNLALDVGERLDEETRQTSTLPYVGRGLLSILKKSRKPPRDEELLRSRMASLVGDKNWEKIEQGAA